MTTTSARRDPGAYGFLVLMVLLGSSTATAAKFAVRELPVGFLPLVRFGGAGLTLLPFVLSGGRFGNLLRRDGLRLLTAGALCVPVNQFFFLSGTRLAPTTHVGLIYALCPLFVLGLAIALGQERLVPGRLLGIVLSVSGAVVIALGNFWQGGADRGNTLAGDLLLLGAVSSWAAYMTVSKPLINRHGAVTVLTGVFLAGALLHAPVALLGSEPWREPLQAASTRAWLSVAYLTFVISVIALACQNLAMRRLDASQVAVVGNLAPALTVLWGVWLLDEPLSLTLLVGGGLTLLGIVWANRASARPQRPGLGPQPVGSVAAEAPTPDRVARASAACPPARGSGMLPTRPVEPVPPGAR